MQFNLFPNKPLVSIIIPAFNCDNFIAETIESCLQQTYSNIEVICVDDQSSDNTMGILNTLAQEYENVTAAQMPRNSKPAAVRNLAINMARGYFILPLDSDDLISPTYIEKAIDIFTENPSIAVVYCKARYFGNCNDDWELPPFNAIEIVEQNMVHCSAIYRKSDWEELGGYCEDLIYGREDWDFWLQFVKKEKFFYRIPEILFYYRQLPSSRSDFLGNMSEVKKTSKIIYRRNIELFIRNLEQNERLNLTKKIKMKLSKFFWQLITKK